MLKNNVYFVTIFNTSSMVYNICQHLAMSNNYGSSVVSMHPICLYIYGYDRSQLFVLMSMTDARLSHISICIKPIMSIKVPRLVFGMSFLSMAGPRGLSSSSFISQNVVKLVKVGYYVRELLSWRSTLHSLHILFF